MTVKVGTLTGGPGQFEQTLDLGDHVIRIVDGLVRFDFDNVRNELEEAGAKVAYIGALSARTTRIAKTAKLTARQLEATVAKEARVAAKVRGDRITDPGVKEEVRSNAQVIAARLAYLEAQEAASILENLKFTLARNQALGQSYVGMLLAEEGARRDPYTAVPGDPLPGARPQRTPARKRT